MRAREKTRNRGGGRQLAAFLRFAGDNFGNPSIDIVFAEFYNLKLVKILKIGRKRKC